MTRMYWVAAAVVVFACASMAGPANAQCAAGKITCGVWCKTYNSTSATCLTGHPRSCDKKPGHANACVRDSCNPGRITCGQWCAKYRANSETCLRTGAGSCMQKYGSLTHCVAAGPPR
jgi:hypothetical protein